MGAPRRDTRSREVDPLSEPVPPGETYIHFTPRQPDSLAGQSSTQRGRSQSGKAPARSQLPAEALGRWPDPAPKGAAAADGRRGSAPAVRPRPAAALTRAAARVAVASHPAETSAGAALERRDTRSGYQDEWLNQVRRAQTPVEVLFTNGGAMYGRVINFDTFAVIMDVDGQTVLVFKHSVMLIRPQGPEAPAGAAARVAEDDSQDSPV